MSDILADMLVVTMTHGMRLRDWADAGLLEREWALYKALARAYSRIVLTTYGDPATERAIAQRLRPAPEILPAPADESEEAQRRFAAHAVADLLSGESSAVVKTNQFHGGDVAVAMAAALREAGVRTALIARGGYPWSRFEAWEHGADSQQAIEAAEQERRLLAAVDRVIATTRAMARDLAWRHNVPYERFHVVPNYVLPTGAPGAIAAQREPGAVLFAGRLAPQKRVDLLIRAVAELDKRRNPAHAPIQLKIVGDGPLASALHGLSALLSAPVAFHPRENHHALRRRMRRCAVYAQVSAYEGHPKTVLEAMADGAAVLIADHSPGFAELIRHGQTGWVADADPIALADALEQLLMDNALRSRLGRAAAERVVQQCALERVAVLEREAHLAAIDQQRQTQACGEPRSAHAHEGIARAGVAATIASVTRRDASP